MSNEKCPICGELNRGLFLKETDGWFICQKCGSSVSNYPNGLAPHKMPIYTMEQLAEKLRKERDGLAAVAG